jgi:AhpD family alkylhydroperoxidase
MRTMGRSPAVLEGYLAFSDALSRGALSAKLREQIALAVAEENSCDYCLAAHCAIGKTVGLSPAQIAGARSGGEHDAKIEAVLALARTIVRQRGQIDDDDLSAIRRVGYGDGEIAEVVAAVALNVFTNYFNHVAQTTVDFPVAPALVAA